MAVGAAMIRAPLSVVPTKVIGGGYAFRYRCGWAGIGMPPFLFCWTTSQGLIRFTKTRNSSESVKPMSGEDSQYRGLQGTVPGRGALGHSSCTAPDSGWVERCFPSAPYLVEADKTALEKQHPFGPAFKRRLELHPGHGSGYRDFLSFSNDLRVLFSDFTYDEEARGQADGQDLLKFHFKITGKNHIRFTPRNEMTLLSGESVVAFHPKGMIKDDWYAAKARETSLTLSCSPSLVLEALQLDADHLPKPLTRFLLDGTPDFFCQSLPLTNRMMQVIEDMLKPPYGQHLRHIHAEARALDLMCMMLDLLTNRDIAKGAPLKLRSSDIEALNGVRDYLRSVYAAPPRVPDLARKFGLNRTKLAEGFKHLFGETIFDYIQRLRMERARELLTETDWSIAAIAETVGYERQSSFSAAFRSQFGFAPKLVRKA